MEFAARETQCYFFGCKDTVSTARNVAAHSSPVMSLPGHYVLSFHRTVLTFITEK